MWWARHPAVFLAGVVLVLLGTHGLLGVPRPALGARVVLHRRLGGRATAASGPACRACLDRRGPDVFRVPLARGRPQGDRIGPCRADRTPHDRVRHLPHRRAADPHVGAPTRGHLRHDPGHPCASWTGQRQPGAKRTRPMTGRVLAIGARDLSPRWRGPIALAVAALAVVAIVTSFWVSISDAPRIAADAYTYLAAGERLNAGNHLYELRPGDRWIWINPPFWTVPLLSPPLIGVLWRPLAALPSDSGLLLWQALTIGTIGATRRGIDGASPHSSVAPGDRARGSDRVRDGCRERQRPAPWWIRPVLVALRPSPERSRLPDRRHGARQDRASGPRLVAVHAATVARGRLVRRRGAAPADRGHPGFVPGDASALPVHRHPDRRVEATAT